MKIARTSVHDQAFQNLVARLSRFLAELNGEEANAFYAPLNQTNDQTRTVVAYDGDLAVGCGAFRPHADGVVEIKRMFVDPAVRGKGVGRAILVELERWALELGSTRAILETSKRLRTANQLYSRSGYRIIPNYGPYVDAKDSVCMERILSPSRD